MLRDYPEHIERLQEALNQYVENPYRKPFDGAIWALLDMLGNFLAESQDELQSAKANGDAEAITKAGQKVNLFFEASYLIKEMIGVDDLYDYFKINEGAFG